jgi:hypothetical protein
MNAELENLLQLGNFDAQSVARDEGEGERT